MSQDYVTMPGPYYLEPLPSPRALANRVLLGGLALGLGLWALMRFVNFGEPEPSIGLGDPGGELPEPEPRIPEWTPKTRL